MKTSGHEELLEKYYKQKKDIISLVDVPAMQFICVDGSGDPNTSEAFRDAVALLYSFSYTLKFMLKKSKKNIDYRVMPLEGCWWMPDMNGFTLKRKADWLWTMMIMQPSWITPAHFSEAAASLRKKKGDELRSLGQERFETIHEGTAAQILHCGPYEKEGPTIKLLHSFIHDNGFALHGKHHEIYFGDPRRGDAAHLKTILRQPVIPAR